MAKVSCIHYSFQWFEIGTDLNLTYLPESPILGDTTVLRGPWAFDMALPIQLGRGPQHDCLVVWLSLEDSEKLSKLNVFLQGFCRIVSYLRPNNNNFVQGGTGLRLQFLTCLLERVCDVSLEHMVEMVSCSLTRV